MRRNLIEEILDSVIPKPTPAVILGRASPGTSDERAKLPKTGTTIIAFKYADGVLFAADRKTTGGYLSILSLDTIKIEKIASHTAMGCAGLVADAQFLKKLMEEVNGSFKSRHGFPLSLEGQVNYATTLCRNFRFYINPWGWGLEIQAVIGGMDVSGEAKIFEIYGEGSLYEKNFTAIGSGTDHAMGVLKDNRKNLFERKLDLEESVEVGVKAVFRAGEADNGTADVRVATPNVAVITKKGFEFVDAKAVKKAVDRILGKEF